MNQNERAIVKASTEHIAARAALEEVAGEMSVNAIIARKRKIVEVMEAVMRDGEHYGKIPGCGDKPTLLKAGAEVLATTFNLAPTFDIRRSDLPGGHREYEITCTLTHIATGAVLGQGLGSCSTMEKKYRWRQGQAMCPNCATPAIMKSKFRDGGREPGWYCHDKRGGCGEKFEAGDERITKQDTSRSENPDLADTYNTVLKMAKKRAQVDCTLTAVGASDILTQDLEDLPREVVTADGDVITMRGKAEAPHLDKNNELERAAIQLIAEIEQCTDIMQLEDIYRPRGEAMPKNSKARNAVSACWNSRFNRLQAAKKSGSKFDPSIPF